MGMRYYGCTDYEIDRNYARTFEEFVALESYINGLDDDLCKVSMADVAYLLENGDDLWGEMNAVQKQEVRGLWRSFVEAFTEKHPHASIYIQYVVDDCGGDARPDDGWYIGIMKRMIKNPDLQELDSYINELSWVQIG